MAYSKALAKEWYKNYTIEQLEELWNKNVEVLINKEAYIKNYIYRFLRASSTVNRTSSNDAVLELLKEKTGKDYSLDYSKVYELEINYKKRLEYAKKAGTPIIEKEEKYLITFNDIFDYIMIDNKDPFWKELFKRFYSKLDFIPESEKMKLLLILYYDKEDCNNLSKDLTLDYDIEALYLKYKNLTDDYFLKHMIIG